MIDINDFKKNFNDQRLLDLALTHRSWVNENSKTKLTNERLEFLGDAVLEFIVSEILFQKYPDREEGFLTALRANLVNTQNLSKAAKTLGVGNLIKLSKGEEETGGRQNISILADCLEAIIGAIYIDRGIESAKSFIIDNVISDLSEIAQKPLKDYKSRLQEAVQAKGFSAPKYMVVDEAGPDHLKTFKVKVVVNGKSIATAVGRSKSEAEQKTASRALSKYI